MESCLGHSDVFNIALQPVPNTIGTYSVLALPEQAYDSSQKQEVGLTVCNPVAPPSIVEQSVVEPSIVEEINIEHY
jgi:hypothetical protein